MKSFAVNLKIKKKKRKSKKAKERLLASTLIEKEKKK